MSNHGTENGVSAVLNDQIHLSDPPHQPDIKIEYLRKFSELISTESYGISNGYIDFSCRQLFHCRAKHHKW